MRAAGTFTAEPSAAIGYTYARMGRRADATRVIAELTERAQSEYIAPTHIAKIYGGLGNLEQAFAWLEKGYQQRDTWLTFLGSDPMWDPIRSDRRFVQMTRRVGIPE